MISHLKPIFLAFSFLWCFSMVSANSTLTSQNFHPDRLTSTQLEWGTSQLHSEDDIQYYAYLNLDTASPSDQIIILAARNQLIYRQSWSANGASGRILRPDGTLEQELPQFYSLFPLDWDPPIIPVDQR